MGNGRRFTRKQYVSPEGRKAPGYYNAGQLHAFLVKDACNGVATEIRWATAAYQQIAQERKQPLDAAFIAVRDEVTAAGKWMPV